ncbi:hypothetical protein RNJ44_00008 [Nakaseomyces bracarensis]|uniref:RFX-type winged-helix domain-containing protein n=1 Tax=Nakaseomyces bracarensis TaxID=273131 RepID=A0ABR4P0V6_9SACH
METKQNIYNNGPRYVLPRFQQTSYSLPHLFQTLNSPFSPRTPASNLAAGNMSSLPAPNIQLGLTSSVSTSNTPILPYHRSNSISVITAPTSSNMQPNLTSSTSNSGTSSITSSTSIPTNSPLTSVASSSNGPRSSGYGIYPLVSNHQFFPSTPGHTPNFNHNYSFSSPRTSENGYNVPGKLELDKSNNSKFVSQKKRDVKNLNTPKSIALKFKDMPLQQYAKVVKDAELKSLELNPQLHTKSTIQSTEQMRERERQIFALIWLLQNCSNKEPHSYVPRGQIFEQYSIVCDQFDLKPLSQASLGKLIRTVFPNLTTRRLGMRGQSKYHYCGLKLLKIIEVPPKFKNIEDDYNDEKSGHSSVQSSPKSRSSFDNNNIKAQIDVTLLDQNIDIEKVEQLKNYCLHYGNEFTSNGTEANAVGDIILPSIFDILKLEFITEEKKDELKNFEKIYNTYCQDVMKCFKDLNFDKMVDVFNMENAGKDSGMQLEKYLALMSCDSSAYVWASMVDVITFTANLKWLVYHLKIKLLHDNDENALQSFSKFFDRLKDFFSHTITEKNYIFAHKFKIFKDFFRIVDILLDQFTFIAKLNVNFRSAQRKMKDNWESKVDHETFISEIESWTDLDQKTRNSIIHTLVSASNSLFDENSSLLAFFNSISEGLHSSLFPHIVNKNPETARKIEVLITQFFDRLVGTVSLKCPEDILEWVYYANVATQLTAFSSKLSQFFVEYSS